MLPYHKYPIPQREPLIRIALRFLAKRPNDPTDPTFTPPAQLSALQNATRARGVEVAVFKAGTPKLIAPMIDEAKAWGATALNVLSAPLFSFNRRIVIERAAALGLPAIYVWPEMAEEDGLIGYGVRLPLVYRQLACLLVRG